MPASFVNFPAKIVPFASTLGPESRSHLSIEQIGLDEAMDLFFWSAEISSTRLDSYFTHMAESTLRNFATESAEGISFLDSHDGSKLGFGQSFDGRVEIADGITRVVSDFYTVPGIEFGGNHSYRSTDDFIKAVKGKLARDVSVGFYPGEDGSQVCDICGGNFFDWRECDHFPGVEYAIGDQGNETITCTLTIEDHHLSEVSAVYDGATPSAMILKAERMNEAGKLDLKVTDYLQTQYRIKLPDPVKQFAGVDIKRSKEMADKSEIELVRQILADIGIPLELPLGESLERLISQVNASTEELTSLRTKVSELQLLADDGKAFRIDLIADALVEGVRAMGDSFPMETYASMLESSNLEHIKQIRDTFKVQGDKILGGGRDLHDDEEDDEDEDDRSEVELVPDSSYAAP